MAKAWTLTALTIQWSIINEGGHHRLIRLNAASLVELFVKD